jgi:hypothetical protein
MTEPRAYQAQAASARGGRSDEPAGQPTHRAIALWYDELAQILDAPKMRTVALSARCHEAMASLLGRASARRQETRAAPPASEGDCGWENEGGAPGLGPRLKRRRHP